MPNFYLHVLRGNLRKKVSPLFMSGCPNGAANVHHSLKRKLASLLALKHKLEAIEKKLSL